jgi:hypothetical protein
VNEQHEILKHEIGFRLFRKVHYKTRAKKAPEKFFSKYAHIFSQSNVMIDVECDGR